MTFAMKAPVHMGVDQNLVPCPSDQKNRMLSINNIYIYNNVYTLT